MSALRNAAQTYEDRCEHAAQPSFDADDCRSAAIDELVAERIREVPLWLRVDFAAGRQSEASADPRFDSLSGLAQRGIADGEHSGFEHVRSAVVDGRRH